MSASERKRKWNQKINVNMKPIYTKFYPGDKAWMMLHNKVHHVTIYGIRYLKDDITMYSTGNSNWHTEDKLHQTKQALWQSLMDEYEKAENEKPRE